MNSKKSMVNRLTKYQKIKYSFIIVMFILFLTVGLPTFSRIKNRTSVNSLPVWDGTVATEFSGGIGTQDEPYIISNASELAFLGTELLDNDFENTYFKLSNDILINNGTFSYNESDGIRYYLNNSTYYLDEFTNLYYSDIEKTGEPVGTINIFESLNNFKGFFDGVSHKITGLYLTSESDYELALFTNLKGHIKDLYIENSLIYGGGLTSALASSASDGSIKNVLFNGFVVGSNSDNTFSTSEKLNDIVINNNGNITFTHNNILNDSEITSSSFTGTCSGAQNIVINGVDTTCSNFSINLGTNIIDTIIITTEGEVTLTNLSYNAVVTSKISGGLVGIGNNITLDNVVNKGFVYGKNIAGGLVGASKGIITINHVYNTGNIASLNVSGGLIGKALNSQLIINKSYNSGIITALNNASLISTINDSELTINNSFATDLNSIVINNLNNSIIDVTNSYYVNPLGNPNNIVNFNLKSIDDLKTKSFMIETLTYSEYLSNVDLETNIENVWIYDNYSLPILFLDDIYNSVASLHVSTYSWNNYSDVPDTIKLKTNILFSIEDINNLMPNREKQYYIHSSNVPLETDLESLTWTNYTSAVSITDEGYYIIYARIVDSNGNIVYLNSDILFVDKTSPEVTITTSEKSWTSNNNNNNYLTVSDAQTFTVSVSDNISGVSKTEYYLSNEIVNPNNITVWNPYENAIEMTTPNNYILYVKSIDNHGNETITSTDLIIYGGYSSQSYVGKNINTYNSENKYLTNKSAISFTYTYNNFSEVINTPIHKLLTSYIVPVNTIITLNDNINHKSYKYVVNVATDMIPFTLFSEIGSNDTKYFIENAYYSNNLVGESFTIVFDFVDTLMPANLLNNSIILNTYDDTSLVRTTLANQLSNFDIYVNSDASINLTSSVNNTINLNSDSVVDVSLNSIINYETINNYPIFDTRYEKMNLGLTIKMEDESGNIISKDKYKNMLFELADRKYYPGQDNIIRINLNTINEVTNVIKITTKNTDTTLRDGTYYLKINNFASDSGLYYNALGSDTIIIPVEVANSSSQTNYGYDVLMDNTNKIINKSNQTEIEFKILKQGELNNPSVKVSLYQKNDLSYTNQEYTLLDLNEYTDTTLTRSGNNTYYASQNMINYNGNDDSYNIFTINLLPDNLENTGYKFVFDLYEDDKKISTIEKYFIVR